MFLEQVPFPFEDPSQQKFIQIDEEGRFLFDGVRLTDEQYGAELLQKIALDSKNRFFVEAKGQWAIVEAFDEPYVAEMVDVSSDGKWRVQLPYQVQIGFKLESLCIDEWDRFHGLCENEIPFVMSRKAQAHFFDLLDEFTDDSITYAGAEMALPSWLIDDFDKDQETFWTGIYETEETPKFDLGQPASGLTGALPQLKLNKLRVAVPGCGKGHDAAHFAEQGHIVTAFDVSASGLAEAKKRYGHLKTLSFVQADVFDLPAAYREQFDLVFEHTLYCAVTPSRRTELMKVWKRMLCEEGHVLGSFFAMDKRKGPPYGGSEWELRKRFEHDFDFLYWTRWKTSLARRLGKEVLIYMKKKS
jgi:SAM-dependent methyltransferase